MNELSPEDVLKFHFPNVGAAFLFYNWYASMHGFSARKSKVLRNSCGEITQQMFRCGEHEASTEGLTKSTVFGYLKQNNDREVLKNVGVCTVRYSVMDNRY